MANLIEAIIFDMGGVLLKTVDPHPREALASRFGTTREELESFIFSSDTSLRSEIGEISDQDHWKTVLRKFNQPIDNYQVIYDEYFSGDAIDDVLLSFVVSLKSKYCLGLLSNAWVNARRLLGARFYFIDEFDVSLFSYEVGLRKPDPKIYQLMVEKMGVKAGKTLFIDDITANVEGAEIAGLRAIRYINTPTLIETITKITNG
ncbi:MAG: HAD family phosphatase [Pelolinea sp.]|nr:HAD family phosphatase [Pelolinea sp.]